MVDPLSSNERVIRLPGGGWKYTDAEYHRRWLARAMAKVRVDANGCWRWQGFKGHTGYAQIGYRGQSANGHRSMYRVYHGVRLRTDQYVLHRCDVRDCINPDHLWVGTQRENLLDMIAKGHHNYKDKTHCKRGHLLAGDNVQITTQHKKPGIRRNCKVCDRLRARGDI